MRIIILADTHMPRMAKVWPAALLPYLEQADHIIHAGDPGQPCSRFTLIFRSS